ncbi:hypothetical protein, partial [Methylobacterium sp. Leaf118]|uniref:COG3904 family protein n=1 Tax=Methylobacterium sp. Leaf118 TaxID=2876562 RepID=UPI001E315DA5
MAAGSGRALRGMRPVRIGLGGLALAAGLTLALAGGHGPHRAAVDPGVRGLVPPLAPPPEGTPTRITLGPGGRDVRLSGELTEGAADRLARLLAANGAVERLHLTSEGGLVDEGAAIGDLVARHGLVTYVPDYCVSACTLAFVRGHARLILEGARLGFHAPYEAGPFGIEIAADSAPERAAYLAAGLDPAFVEAALAVRPDDLMIPDTARLLAARVATGVVAADVFPDSTLDEGDDPERARAAVLRDVPLLGDLEARAPAAVRAIAERYRAAYGEGRSEREAFDAVRRRAAQAIADALQEAPAVDRVALGRLALRALERTGAAGEGACAAAGGGIGVLLIRGGLGEAGRSTARA